MKKILLYIILCATVGLVSCSDEYLDRLPQTKIPETQEFFNTETGLKSFSDGFYSYFSTGEIRGDEGNSDNTEHTGSPGTRRTGLYSMPTALGSGGWNWTAIRNVNYFIERCEASTLEPDIKNQYLGLAKFFRAFLYFEKVKAFGDVPWYSKSLETSDEEELYKPQDSRVLVMDSVLNDLNAAIEFLPETKYHNRISKWTALAFKSRISLYEATWRKYHPSYNLPDADKFFAEASAAAKELIEEGSYQLYSTGDVENDYRMMFLTTSAPADETILAISFPQDGTGGSIQYNSTLTDYSTGNNGATHSLAQDYFMADGSSFSSYYSTAEQETMPFYEEIKNREPRLANTIITPGYVRHGTTTASDYGDFNQNRTGYQIHKRVGPETYVDYRDVILMRYSEILLNYAEAETELGNGGQALLDATINKIRNRVGLAPRTYPMIADQHQRDMYQRIANDDNLLEIRHERRVELAFEGFRTDDIMRWGEGHLLRKTYEGIYLEKGINNLLDLDGDGTSDVNFVRSSPSETVSGVTYVVLLANNGFSNGDENGGRIIPYNRTYQPFEDWEYLNPIPIEELTLNPNLVQNPGKW